MTALLKNQRAYVKGRITYFTKQLQEKSFTLYQLDAIKSHIPQLYARFDKIQSEIEEKEPGEVEKEERCGFDNSYCDLQALLLSKLGPLYDNKEKILPTNVKCRLPEIDLPKFDGKYSSWVTFRDEFTSLVHQNATIDNIDKFRYLVSAVNAGSAFHIIEHLPRSNQNYPVAWQRLVDTFDNETLIKKNYIRDIYNIRNVKDNCAVSLQQFLDTFLKYFNALKALGVDVTSWDLFMVHHLSIKLDLQSRKEIEKNSSVDTLLTIDRFIEILRKRCRYMNAIYESNTKSNRIEKVQRTMVATSLKCSSCLQGSHEIYRCEKFLSMTPIERFDLVKRRKLCINCLSCNHALQKCSSRFHCRECGKRHHGLLHRSGSSTSACAIKSNENAVGSNKVTVQNTKATVTTPVNSSTSDDCISINCDSDMFATLTSTHANDVCDSGKVKQIVIATAVIWVFDNSGMRIPCRVVLDSASQANFITEHFCQQLNVCRKSTSVTLSGIGNVVTKSRQIVTLSLASRLSSYTTDLDFIVLPKITGNMPVRSFVFNKSNLPNSIELADPYFNESRKIDMLIGAEIYHEIVTGERVVICDGLPPFIKSCFGLIIAGRVTEKLQEIEEAKNICHSLITTLDAINESIQKFWTVETVDASISNLSLEERDCEEHYATNVRRNEFGRYIVGLPLKSSITELSQSSESARQQFLRLEQRLLLNDDLRQRFSIYERV